MLTSAAFSLAVGSCVGNVVESKLIVTIIVV